jgi:hypothetical protein
LGLINIPSSRTLEQGFLKLHLVNSYPINSLFISANPFDWMEVSLRYADINTMLYSKFYSFSGDQTYKDKSFNLKLKLIEETENFPELSIGFRDFIGTGKFSGEYIVSSKRVGDFDFTVGLGWGSLSSKDGIDNPFIDLNESFSRRVNNIGQAGEIEFERWFRGKKASAFYGFEYLNKLSGIRFKVDYDSSNEFKLKKESNYSFGLSIPASDFLDINLFRHRGTSLGFGFSFKANYSNPIIPKNETIPIISFSDEDTKIIASNDEVFSGTLNAILSQFGIYTQDIFLDGNNLEIIIDQSKYRNLNVSSKRLLQLSEEILNIRSIKNIKITYQKGPVNIGSITFNVGKFENFLDNSISLPELKRSIFINNYVENSNSKKIFKGIIDFPLYTWGIRPELKNHVGAPESFYSGQFGLMINGGINFNKNSALESSISLSFFQNLDQLRLRAFSRLPKVRSDIREYLKEKYALKSLSYSYLFDPIYSSNNLFFGGIKVGLFEEMYGGVGGEILYRDIRKPWYFTANYYWVKQRQFNQRFSFRNYETFTGHLNFIWETPITGVKLILSGGRYLAKDSGITLNLSKTFKSGFTLGFFASKTDISAFEFGEGSFDKGIYFSIPLDLVSRKYRSGNARFVWKNLVRDGAAMLSGGLELQGYVENISTNYLDYFSEGYYE